MDEENQNLEQPAVEEGVQQLETNEQGESPEAKKPKVYGKEDYDKNFNNYRETKEREIQQLKDDLTSEREDKRRLEKRKVEEKFKIDDDDIPDGSHINHQNEKLENLEKSVQLLNVKNRLITENTDFYNTVTSENAEKLRKLKPSFYESINATPDLYKGGKAMYDAIQEFVLKPSGSGGSTTDESKKIIQDNLNKPKNSAQASASSPLAYVNSPTRRWSQNEKDENYKRWRANHPK